MIRQLFELGAHYVEPLWPLDQPPGTLEKPCCATPSPLGLSYQRCTARFRKNLALRAQSGLSRLGLVIRECLVPTEAYDMVPRGEPQSRRGRR